MIIKKHGYFTYCLTLMFAAFNRSETRWCYSKMDNAGVLALTSRFLKVWQHVILSHHNQE